jgi:ABC-2 type transport system ATP-binding protein
VRRSPRIRRFLRQTTSAAQVQELVETLEIGSFLRNPMGSYSSGMLKKTSLVLAFLGNPSLILLDEPLITIDQKAVEKIYELVNRYHDLHGVSFLLSSHQDFRLSDLTVSNRYRVQDKRMEWMNPV